MEKDAINLTLIHQWMTVSDAEILLIDAYRRFRSSKKYGGNMVNTLMDIEYRILQRSSEDWVRAKLDLVKSRMDSNSTGRDTP
jgi:hypothetical protein